jgi:hypothetical protein
VLTVEAPDRAPIASPLWYTVEPDGTITFSVGASSQKTRLLQAAKRATLCVQSEALPYSYVSVSGPIDDLGSASDEARRERAHRYLGTELGEAYHLSTRADPDVTFALRPQRWASADYNKEFA